MKRNLSPIDRLLRVVVVAPLVVWLALAVGVGTTLGVVALVFAGLMVATGASGLCPSYTLAARLPRRGKLAPPGTGR
jgi:hypothetical protein